MSASAPKKAVKKTTPAAAPAPVAAPVAAPEPAAPKKAAKKASAAASEVAPPAPVVAAPVEAPAAEAAVETSFEDELRAVQESLTAVRDAAAAALAGLKRLAKRHSSEVKDARKNRRAKRVATEESADTPRKPNNFEKMVPISDELSAFLGGGKNNQMSRSQVNKAINEYCKSHSLSQGQNINPDAALRKLLTPPEGTQLTIFNIQTYLKRHYPKKSA